MSESKIREKTSERLSAVVRSLQAREYKFKALFKNKLYDVNSITFDDDIVTIPKLCFPFVMDVQADAIIDYSGYTDIDGEEIYETDVVTMDNRPHDVINFIIMKNDKNEYCICVLYENGIISVWGKLENSKVKKVGNFLTNPELLE